MTSILCLVFESSLQCWFGRSRNYQDGIARPHWRWEHQLLLVCLPQCSAFGLWKEPNFWRLHPSKWSHNLLNLCKLFLMMLCCEYQIRSIRPTFFHLPLATEHLPMVASHRMLRSSWVKRLKVGPGVSLASGWRLTLLRSVQYRSRLLVLHPLNGGDSDCSCFNVLVSKADPRMLSVLTMRVLRSKWSSYLYLRPRLKSTDCGSMNCF